MGAETSYTYYEAGKHHPDTSVYSDQDMLASHGYHPDTGYFIKNGIPFQKKWDSISKKMGFHFNKNGIPFQKKWDSIS